MDGRSVATLAPAEPPSRQMGSRASSSIDRRMRPATLWTLLASALLAANSAEPESAEPTITLRVPVALERFSHQTFDAVELPLLGELKVSLELNQQLQRHRPEAAPATEIEDDVLDALKALGYLD